MRFSKSSSKFPKIRRWKELEGIGHRLGPFSLERDFGRERRISKEFTYRVSREYRTILFVMPWTHNISIIGNFFQFWVPLNSSHYPGCFIKIWSQMIKNWLWQAEKYVFEEIDFKSCQTWKVTAIPLTWKLCICANTKPSIVLSHKCVAREPIVKIFCLILPSLPLKTIAHWPHSSITHTSSRFRILKSSIPKGASKSKCHVTIPVHYWSSRSPIG